MKYTPLFIFIFVSQACCAKHFILSKWVDEKLGIHEMINHYDPLRLPVMTDTFDIEFANVTVTFSDGMLNGLSTVERVGDFSLSYHPDAIRLHARLRFEKDLEAKFNCSYILSESNLSDKGTTTVFLKNAVAELIVEWKLSELFVAKSSIRNLDGDFDWIIKGDSNLPYDPASHYVKPYLDRYFKRPILARVEFILTSLAQIIVNKVQENNFPTSISDFVRRVNQAIENGTPGANVLHLIGVVISETISDPMILPDILSPPVKLPGLNDPMTVNLTSNELSGLSTLKLDSNMDFIFLSTKIRFTGAVFFEELTIKANCSYASGSGAFNSVLTMSLQNVTADLSVDFDLINWTPENPDVNIDFKGPFVTMNPTPNNLIGKVLVKELKKTNDIINVTSWVGEALIVHGWKYKKYRR